MSWPYTLFSSYYIGAWGYLFVVAMAMVVMDGMCVQSITAIRATIVPKEMGGAKGWGLGVVSLNPLNFAPML